LPDDPIPLPQPTPLSQDLAFFAAVAQKGDLFARQYVWTQAEVRAGRMTPEQQLQRLNRLWVALLASADLPPLPVEFSC
jgi:hypothetical protein